MNKFASSFLPLENHFVRPSPQAEVEAPAAAAAPVAVETAAPRANPWTVPHAGLGWVQGGLLVAMTGFFGFGLLKLLGVL